MSAAATETEEARLRRAQRLGPRELRAQALVACLFLVAAGMLVVFGLDESIPLTDFALLVLAGAVLGRLDFEFGAYFTVPTQLIFVPMLFVLPPAVVPLAAAASSMLDRLPNARGGQWHPQRLLAVLGDMWYAVGPALVFVLADVGAPDLGDWPIYLVALAAQFAGDFASTALRDWLARGIQPRISLSVARDVWIVDLLLSPIGLLAAFMSFYEHYAYLLVLPLAFLLKIFARDRHERIDQEIELSSAYRGTALLLGDVIEADDEYTGQHSKGVVELAVAIADELRCDEEQRRLVEFGALLHDIGKIATPKELINKAGPLNADEWDIMREHTIHGQEMLDRVGGTLHDVGLIVRSSHEHFDGRGYPDGLAGAAIPLAARIVTVADSYSAMTTRRSYRDAMAHELAIAELRANSGTQFDPAVVEATLRVLATAPWAQQRAADAARLAQRG